MYPDRIVRSVCLLFAVGIGFVSLPSRAAKRRFTVSDDIGVVHFGDIYLGKANAVTFSPDGRYFVVDTERGLIEKNRPESTLRVYRTEDVHQFVLNSQASGEPPPWWIISKSTYKNGPIITNTRWRA